MVRKRIEMTSQTNADSACAARDRVPTLQVYTPFNDTGPLRHDRLSRGHLLDGEQSRCLLPLISSCALLTLYSVAEVELGGKAQEPFAGSRASYFGRVGVVELCAMAQMRRTRFPLEYTAISKHSWCSYQIRLQSSIATLQPAPTTVLRRACAGARCEWFSTAISRCSSSSSLNSATTDFRTGTLGWSAGRCSNSFS